MNTFGPAPTASAAPPQPVAAASLPTVAQALAAVPTKGASSSPASTKSTADQGAAGKAARPWTGPALGPAPQASPAKGDSPKAEGIASDPVAECLAAAKELPAKTELSLAAWCKAQVAAPDSPPALMEMQLTGLTTCPAGGAISASEARAASVARTQPVAVAQGGAITVKTSALAQTGNPFASEMPDTVLYLLRCGANSCDQGTIVAVDDDGNDETQGRYAALDSKIVAYNLPAGSYFALVTSYSSASQGQATVSWQVAGQTEQAWANTVFGGLQFDPGEVREGDAILVGKTPDTAALVAQVDGVGALMYPGLAAEPDYPDSVAWVLSTRTRECDSGACGQYWRNDDAWLLGSYAHSVLLSRVMMTGLPPEQPLLAARVLAGPYSPWVVDAQQQVKVRTMNLRAMQVRRALPAGAWDCVEQLDNDGDGLPWELEQVLGSCDRVEDAAPAGMGAAGHSCQAWADAINARVNFWQPQITCNPPDPCQFPATNTQGPARCWSARDSDNDGLSDLGEVWAVAASFAAAPAPPFGETPAPNYFGLFDPGPACPTVWCVGENLSALSDPRPDTYDLYLQADAVNCNGTHCSADLPAGAPTSQALVPAQAQTLWKFWTDTPSRCWDGSLPPCPNGISASLDLGYRIKMHAYPGLVHDLPDTLTLEEAVWQGNKAGRPFFDEYFDQVWKALRIGRYALLMPNQGQAGERHFVTANDKTSAAAQVDQMINPLSHEFGHVLGLAHPHDNWVRPATTCGGGTSQEAGKCNESICAVTATDLSCDCTPETTTNCQEEAGDGSNNRPNNPAAASIMNYHYAGALSPGAAAPVDAALPNTGECLSMYGGPCDWQNASFSKGLNPTLDEASLPESFDLDWQGGGLPATWGVVKFARDLQCYDHDGDDWGCGPFGVRQTTAPLQVRGPLCSAASQPDTCSFNWDRNTDLSSTSTATDLSRGNFSAADGGSALCRGDWLSDTDEWGLAVSLARTRLSKTAEGGVAIYRDMFNGSSAPFNYAGWSPWALHVTHSPGLVLSSGTYRRNQCRLGGQACPGGACILPSCVDSSDCGVGACTGGQCVDEVGVCPCASIGNDECGPDFLPEQSCDVTSTPMKCRWNVPSDQQYGAGQGRQHESAVFGPSTNSWIKLNYTPGNPLDGIAATDVVHLNFDFYWDGFAANQTSQTLVDSASVRAEIVSVGPYGNWLKIQVPGAVDALWSKGPVEVGRWYRIRYVATKWGNVAWLTTDVRSLISGLFDGKDPGSGCWKRALTSTLAMPSASDVWIGSPAGGSGDGFRGRLDNVVLLNQHEGIDPPKNCLEVP